MEATTYDINLSGDTLKHGKTDEKMTQERQNRKATGDKDISTITKCSSEKKYENRKWKCHPPLFYRH